MTDGELIGRFVQTGCGESFAELVDRHAGLVYSTCLRRLGDAHLAEDATQAVFVILARKAGKLGRRVVISNWLFRTARNVAANARRARERRRRHEAMASETPREAAEPVSAEWSDIRGHLDSALDSLPSSARSAVLLRYIEGKPHTEVAAELGCSRDTARMRARRGLDRLRSVLAGRGVSVPAAALAGVMGARAVEQVPAGLVPAIAGACTGKAALGGGAAAIAEGALKAMTMAKLKTVGLVLGAVLAAGGGTLGAAQLMGDGSMAAPAAVPAGAKEILTEKSYWRWYVELRKPTYEQGGEEKPLKRTLKARLHGDADQLVSPAPPADWAKPEFDDAAWARSRAEWCRWLVFSRFSTARACFRGKFTVTNPGGADLYLTLKYIGGAIVYLNGREVGRGDVPEGKLDARTPGNPYGDKFYKDASGRFFPMRSSGDIPKYTKMRLRTMGPVRLPKDTLKPGTNVLAVEIRRSPYQAFCLEWFNSQKNLGQKPWWPHADLAEVRLLCAGAGALPNVSRPRGVQVWNHDRNDRVTVFDYGDPAEKLRPVKVVGARNGSFCGQVVVSSDSALAGVKVTPAALKGPGGSIPAGNVTVLYGNMDWPSRTYGAWSHGLLEKAPASVAVNKAGGGAVLPVLFRVKVPADAKAGEYKGSLAVNAGGKSVTFPVELYVADWKVPDPGDYRTYMGVYQSPTSLMMQYNVKLWSEEHWNLVRRSFEHLGRIGNKMVNVEVVDETQFGNPEGIVWWVRKPGGGYEYDFTQFDRLMKIVTETCGKQDYVCLQIWHAGGWSARKADNKCTVQLLDRKTGKRKPMQVPLWGTPEATAFWKPFFAAVQARLVKLNMPKAMTVGILSDSTAPNEVFKTMSEAWPGGKAMWHRGCHGTCRYPKPYSVSKVGRNYVQLHEHCYGMSMVGPEGELPPLHTYRGWPGTAYFRVSGHESATTLLSYRTMPERGMFCRKQGIGRICLDFFSVLKGPRGKSTHIYNRYPHSSCAQRQPTLKKLVWAGPDGPATTMRYEALCEGVQECDALIVVSEGAAGAGRVGAELAKKCEGCIRDHLWYCHTRNQHRWSYSYVHMNHNGWQELSRRTFDLAGEVSRKLGK